MLCQREQQAQGLGVLKEPGLLRTCKEKEIRKKNAFERIFEICEHNFGTWGRKVWCREGQAWCSESKEGYTDSFRDIQQWHLPERSGGCREWRDERLREPLAWGRMGHTPLAALSSPETHTRSFFLLKEGSWTVEFSLDRLIWQRTQKPFM